MNRVEKIRAKRAELDEQVRREENERERNIKYYTERIKALAPRLRELHDVAIECMLNKIPLGNMTYLHGSPHYPEFESEWWYHRTGFIRKGNDVFFGKIGGGCCGENLMINKNGVIVANPLDVIIGTRTYERAYFDFCDKCASFLNAFDDFEKGFYSYIDNL